MRALEGRLGKQDAVVGDDAHRHAFDAGKAGDQGGAKARLELVKLRAVHDAGNDLAHVKRFARIDRDHTVQLFCCIFRSNNLNRSKGWSLFFIQIFDSSAGQRQCVGVILGEVVGHARQAGVHIAAA